MFEPTYVSKNLQNKPELKSQKWKNEHQIYTHYSHAQADLS